MEQLASKIVWIFGSSRNGSTWLARMLSDSGSHRMWNEPLVGSLFGDFYFGRALDKGGNNYILSGKYADTWLPLLRSFVLESAHVRYPEIATSVDRAYLFVKGPNGSLGSPLLMSALPESRMIFLVRDPRDSIASKLDARLKGGWLHESLSDEQVAAHERRDLLQETRLNAQRYRQSITRTLEAYRNHQGPRTLVNYEELRSDTPGALDRISSELSLSLNEAGLAQATEKHSWKNVPEDQKGPGKKFRKGVSGGWREDLSPGQVRLVERITGPLMDEFGYVRSV